MRWDERQARILETMKIRVADFQGVRGLTYSPPAPPPGGESLRASLREIDRSLPNPPSERESLRASVRAEGAAAADIAQMDWPALRVAVTGCTACSLCESRRNTVFGVGNLRSHWMIVGEAPGEQEDVRGEPFVGKAGQLLDNMLRAIGLTRAEGLPARQVFIANTLKCRPPANRNPQPEELTSCEPYLKRQIALVQPRIIVAMGRFAVQSLLATSEPVGKLRGRVHRYQGVPLVVTYHPAYLLRNLEDKAKAWDDLCLALEVANAAAATHPG